MPTTRGGNARARGFATYEDMQRQRDQREAHEVRAMEITALNTALWEQQQITEAEVAHMENPQFNLEANADNHLRAIHQEAQHSCMHKECKRRME